MLAVFFSLCFALVPLFDDNNQPVDALKDLLELVTSIRKNKEPLDSMESIRDYFSKAWGHTLNGSFDPPSVEREGMNIEEKISSSQIKKFYNCFKRLGMIDPNFSESDLEQTDDIILIVSLGGHFNTTVERFDRAKNFYNKIKGKCKDLKILILATARPLDRDSKEPYPVPIDDGAPANLQTEEDVGYYLASLNKDFPVTVVRVDNATNLKKRGSIRDRAVTLKHWLEVQTGMKKGIIIIVSRQPLDQYRLATFEKVFKGLPYTFKMLSGLPTFLQNRKVSLDGILPGSPPLFSQMELAALLDTFSRSVSIEVERRKQEEGPKNLQTF